MQTHNDRNNDDVEIQNEVERQKAIEKTLDCKFIRINSYEQNFIIFKTINKIHRHLKSSKKSLIDKTSRILLELVKLFNNNEGFKLRC